MQARVWMTDKNIKNIMKYCGRWSIGGRTFRLFHSGNQFTPKWSLIQCRTISFIDNWLRFSGIVKLHFAFCVIFWVRLLHSVIRYITFGIGPNPTDRLRTQTFCQSNTLTNVLLTMDTQRSRWPSPSTYVETSPAVISTGNRSACLLPPSFKCHQRHSTAAAIVPQGSKNPSPCPQQPKFGVVGCTQHSVWYSHHHLSQ